MKEQVLSLKNIFLDFFKNFTIKKVILMILNVFQKRIKSKVQLK